MNFWLAYILSCFNLRVQIVIYWHTLHQFCSSFPSTYIRRDCRPMHVDEFRLIHHRCLVLVKLGSSMSAAMELPTSAVSLHISPGTNDHPSTSLDRVLVMVKLGGTYNCSHGWSIWVEMKLPGTLHFPQDRNCGYYHSTCWCYHSISMTLDRFHRWLNLDCSYGFSYNSGLCRNGVS